MFAFIGVTKPEFIVAEGLMVSAQQRENSLQSALQTVGTLRAA